MYYVSFRAACRFSAKMSLQSSKLITFAVFAGFFVATARLVDANHSTCSWQPFKSGPGVSFEQQGWIWYCTADLDPKTNQYRCKAYNPTDRRQKVADWGALAPNVLELGMSFSLCIVERITCSPSPRRFLRNCFDCSDALRWRRLRRQKPCR